MWYCLKRSWWCDGDEELRWWWHRTRPLSLSGYYDHVLDSLCVVLLLRGPQPRHLSVFINNRFPGSYPMVTRSCLRQRANQRAHPIKYALLKISLRAHHAKRPILANCYSIILCVTILLLCRHNIMVANNLGLIHYGLIKQQRRSQHEASQSQ